MQYKSIQYIHEGNVLFNEALNTFDLRLDSEREILLLLCGLLFPISSKCSFICTILTDRIANTTAFVRPVVDHWLEREIAQWVHPMKD